MSDWSYELLTIEDTAWASPELIAEFTFRYRMDFLPRETLLEYVDPQEVPSMLFRAMVSFKNADWILSGVIPIRTLIRALPHGVLGIPEEHLVHYVLDESGDECICPRSVPEGRPSFSIAWGSGFYSGTLYTFLDRDFKFVQPLLQLEYPRVSFSRVSSIVV